MLIRFGGLGKRKVAGLRNACRRGGAVEADRAALLSTYLIVPAAWSNWPARVRAAGLNSAGETEQGGRQVITRHGHPCKRAVRTRRPVLFTLDVPRTNDNNACGQMKPANLCRRRCALS
jgi:hypothetical protein